MRKTVLSYLFSLSAFLAVYSQTVLPNMNMEEWIEHPFSTGSYWEPGGGIWTTANRAVLLNPEIFKITTFRTDDAYEGNYAAMMVTDLAELPGNDLLQAGALATGYFNELAPPPTNLKDGVPFTGRPLRFKAYYKYFSVNHDSCDMWAILYKWNPALQHRDTLAVAWITDTVRVTEWTQFNIPFIYQSDQDPDTISIVFSPSAAGDTFEGQVGSTLYIDDISLEFENGVEWKLMSEVTSRAYPNPSQAKLTIELSCYIDEGRILFFDIQGKQHSVVSFSGSQVDTDVSGFAPGYYQYQVMESRKVISGGNFIVSGK